jgi:ADP-heptose:LPS heptosyltransferase
MPSPEKIPRLNTIKFDCRFYTGYKPCGKADVCEGCPHYSPQGKRILVIKLAAMGDVLRTTCILPGLAKHYQPCHITWLTDAESEALLNTNPHIARLMSFDPSNLLVLLSEEFDLLLNFEKEPRALALANMVRAREKRGFAPSSAGTLTVFNPESEYALQLGLSDELKFRQNTKTYPQIIYEMAGLPYRNEEYVLELSERSKQFAGQFAKKYHLADSKHVVGINTGCGSVFQTKQWTVDGFVALINHLSKEPGVCLLLLGGPRERSFNAEIMHQCSQHIIDTGCDNSLEDFLGIVSTCDLVVSSDSLTMHIAIGLKKQVVAFFGSTCPAEVDLFGRGEKIVSDFPCAPCYKTSCSMNPSCMEALSADQVLAAVKRILAKRPAS